MKKWVLVGLLAGTFVPTVGAVAAFTLWQKTQLIAFGVQINGINVGGMNLADARKTLEGKFKFFSSDNVTVTHQGQVILKIPLERLGIKPNFDEALKNALQVGRRKPLKGSFSEFLNAWRFGLNLPMVYDYDEESAQTILKQIAQSLSCLPREAFVEWHEGAVRIVPSQDGIIVSVEETMKLWAKILEKGRWETLPLVVTKIRPEVTTEDLATIEGVVGQATTYFKTSERNRSHNIRLAASKLDHLFIRPKETISFNELVGPRTASKGFRVARVLVQGQFTQDFGGGVCQVSGTLYLAALQAGMEVVQRHRHSRPVAYLPPGLDATVNFGYLDLKLRNPFDTPLYLRTFVKGGRLTVLILGKRQQGVTYKIVRTASKFGKPSVKQIFSPKLPSKVSKVLDKGSSGYHALVWRLKIKNGIVMKRELISSDIYLPAPRLILIGQRVKDNNIQLNQSQSIEPKLPEPMSSDLKSSFKPISPMSASSESASSEQPSLKTNPQ